MNATPRFTYGEYPQPPPPRVAPQFACTHRDCLEPGVAQLDTPTGGWKAGFCEKHWHRYWTLGSAYAVGEKR